MGKRSDFERIPQDFYPTPAAAVAFLRPHLPDEFTFCEPCAGDGQLTRHLEAIGGVCTAQYDIEPRGTVRMRGDARNILSNHLAGAEFIITNSPWDRAILHALIVRFSRLAPTWMLFDSDWLFTAQAAPFLRYVRKIVAVGRLRWIEGSPFTGKDNCAWFEIGPPSDEAPRFFGRLDVG